MTGGARKGADWERMVGAKASTLKEQMSAEAKERMRAGGGDKKSSAAKSGPANLPDPISGDTRDAIGKAVGVSGKSIDHATLTSKRASSTLTLAFAVLNNAANASRVLSSLKRLN